MRLRTLLETGELGLRLLSGQELLDRPLHGVMTTDLRDPSRYLHGGELVLTGLAWWRGPGDAEPFVRVLVEAGVAGLAAGEAEFGSVPEDVTLACARHRLPLFAVAEEVSFAEITEHVVRRVSGERAGDLAAVVDRHRRLMSASPAGGGPQAVLDLLGADLDLRAWLLTATGRPIAVAGDERLPAAVAARLAAHHLAEAGAGRPGPYRLDVDPPAGGDAPGGVFALFPVGTGAEPTRGAPAPGEDPRRTVLSGWLLAVRADAREWPAQRVDLLDGVARLVATERDRREASRTVPRRLAQDVLELVGAGAPPAEVAARLRVAARVLVPGLAAPHWQVVTARVAWPDARFDAGPVGRALLEELLAEPVAERLADGTVPDPGVAVAHVDGEAVALVPLPADEPADAGSAALRAERILAPARGALAGALGGDGRLSLGASAAVPSADGLRGALEEARHARRLAAARPAAVSGADHEELASHVLLLPFVPDEVRRAFAGRLLDPLADYDRRHRADLVATLAAFLAVDGSWTRCAARLHLHVNSLRYRIARIERLTGRDLGRLEDRVDFFLALRLR
ncbi:PucR family transcriptional regulator ligand-binding domain-containing protein [Streptomyces sp. B6B3]|uniref:PucR family transcriptional regulator n=1 Tax=Streptomyces sp. B6B3 TaxID=3153570 RepID=UPI00325E0137